MTAHALHRSPSAAADWRRRYEVVGELGSGGFADVYEAFDHELERPVALKVIDERRGVPSRVAREVEAAASLSHIGIVRLYDVFLDDERSILVYELVEGDSIEDLVGVLDDADSLEVTAQVLEALAHAHAQGVVHRDIKPANVMLSSDGMVKVMDFGIARLTGADTLTAEGDMIGTIAYMSPEQAAGRRVGPASDVYSTAVMLYELLTGEHPSPGRTPGERLGHIAAGRTIPLAEVRPELPPGLLQMMDAALSPAPADRPAASDLAVALRRVAASGELPRRRPVAVGDLSRMQGLAERIAGAGLAGASTWFLLGLLHAYPGTWRLPLVALVLAVWTVVPPAGLAVFLGVLAFPLFDVSVWVGVVYLPAALVALLLGRGRPVSVVWPALALLLMPLYAALLAPAVAGVLGRVRGPLTAAWAGAATAAWLTLTGDGGTMFTFFRPAGTRAADIAAADGLLGTLGGIAAVLASPEALLQAGVWAVLAAALPLAVEAPTLGRRLWLWGATMAGLTLACAFLPTLVPGSSIAVTGLLLNVSVVAVVTLAVTLPGLPAAAPHGHPSAVGGGDTHGVQEA